MTKKDKELIIRTKVAQDDDITSCIWSAINDIDAGHLRNKYAVSCHGKKMWIWEYLSLNIKVTVYIRETKHGYSLTAQKEIQNETRD